MAKKILLSIIGAMAVSFRFSFLTSNILTAFVALGIFLIMSVADCEENKNEKIASVFMGVLCSFSVIMSYEAEWFAKGNYGLFLKWFGFIIMIVGFYSLFRCFSRWAINKLSQVSIIEEKNSSLSEKKIFLIAFAVIYFVWILFFLKDFPANITTDSGNQLSQALGMREYSDHHPLAHTFIIKWLVSLGSAVFGSLNGGVAFYTCVQMLCLALSFSYLVATIYKFGIKRKIVYGVILFFAITPYHAVYAHTMWKDIWFAAVVTCFCTTLWRIIENKEKYIISELIQLFVMGIGMCLFRSNGLYVYIVMVPILIWYFSKKRLYTKQIIGVCLSALIVALVIKIPVYKSINVIPPDTVESLSIPLQQVARVVTNNKSLSDEQKSVINNIAPIEEIPVYYNPVISDGMKNLIRDKGNQDYIKGNMGEVLGTYIGIGFKHPIEYLNAVIDETKGYWYPDYQYWVYPAEFNSPSPEISQKSFYSEGVNSFIDGYNNIYKNVPILGLLWSIGTFVWIMIFMTMLVFAEKKYKCIIVYLPMIGIWATLLIATPVFCEFRYIYSLFTVMPLLLCLPFYRSKEIKK